MDNGARGVERDVGGGQTGVERQGSAVLRGQGDIAGADADRTSYSKAGAFCAGEIKPCGAGVGEGAQRIDLIGAVQRRPADRRTGEGVRRHGAAGLGQRPGGVDIDRRGAHRAGDVQGRQRVVEIKSACAGIGERAQIADLIGAAQARAADGPAGKGRGPDRAGAGFVQCSQRREIQAGADIDQTRDIEGHGVVENEATAAGVGENAQIADQIGAVERRAADRCSSEGRRNHFAGADFVQHADRIEIEGVARAGIDRSGDVEGDRVLEIDPARPGIAEVPEIADRIGSGEGRAAHRRSVQGSGGKGPGGFVDRAQGIEGDGVRVIGGDRGVDGQGAAAVVGQGYISGARVDRAADREGLVVGEGQIAAAGITEIDQSCDLIGARQRDAGGGSGIHARGGDHAGARLRDGSRRKTIGQLDGISDGADRTREVQVGDGVA